MEDKKLWMLQQRQRELGNSTPGSFTRFLRKKSDASKVTLDQLTVQLFIPMVKGRARDLTVHANRYLILSGFF